MVQNEREREPSGVYLNLNMFSPSASKRKQSTRKGANKTCATKKSTHGAPATIARPSSSSEL
eukprot:593314-Alexandrium_andersonii.AAC.1